MGLYVDEDSRRLYSIQDLCIEEIEALRHAIDTAPPPYRATLERLRHHLASI